MEGNLKVITLSYKSAPIEVREKVSLNESDSRTLLEKFKEIIGLSEVLILSTCNRTEVYYTSDVELSQDIIKLICIEKGLNYDENIIPYFQIINDEYQALVHLFRVAIGLESQVVGDLQITNQVKNAYQWTADAQLAGPYLHRLLHSIFFTNKKVVQETPFRDGAASVSYAAVEMVQELTSTIESPRVLVIGVGEIGTDVVRNLMDSSITDVRITNRTYEKALNLAHESGFQAVPFEYAWNEIESADVIISSIAMNQPFFTKEKIEALDLLSFKCFVDLSIPRSVEKQVEDIAGAIVYNVDDLHNRANKALKCRLASIPDVEAIIETAIRDFKEWSREMIFSPTIQKFKEALEQIRKEEISKFMKKMDEKEAKVVDKVTKSMMNKIIKLPVLQLKAACKRGEAETLVEVLNDLFNLEKERENKTEH